MSEKEHYTHMSWCLNNGIRIYPVTEFEYQHRKLLSSLNKGEIGKEMYKFEKERLLNNLKNSKDLHIAVERKNRVSIGDTIFYTDKKNSMNATIWEQIRIIYKMIYEKENLAVTT